MSFVIADTDGNVSEYLGYEEAKGRICIRVINYEHNQESIRNLSYIVVEDLAVLFCYVPDDPAHTGGKVLSRPLQITRRDLDNWKIDADRLFLDAAAASAGVHPPFLIPMRRLLGLSGELDEGEIPMYVLSCRDARYGASALFYPGVLHSIALGLLDDLYIIPSSVHELILLRAEDVKDADALRTMIRDINRSEVDPSEVLSNSLYYYDRWKDRLQRTLGGED